MENYYEKAKNEANNFFAAEGTPALYSQGGNIAMGEDFYAQANDRRAVSQPLVIIAENTGTASDSAVELLDAATKAYSTTPEITGAGSLIKLTSGVPGVTFPQIIRGIANGETYRIGHIRIQVLDATTESLKNSAGDSSIEYATRTNLGERYATPLYPMISTVQQVEYIRDIMTPIIINNNTKFTVTEVTAGTKIRYMFYPAQIGSPTADLIAGNTAKNLDVKNPNVISWA